ncbi:peptide-methionine (R)-S-oxide reductase MsrB [Aliiroseovarius crassostreae]|uniref:peptide-methionine (R)-S-oxide reductase MsrB n=1 Tax=Aliiroseovarius crassostreae TaxID=154981 RepID=UPI0021AE8A91|nr:peptide-methionine (R)-S-oxide reductase MsrB [Aliiroseovarius crassostreae]UWP89991.1 peptide-methionine (R)-S-oxide reductase MsrB [Aliiroseovarius crassostreae]UWP93150.1 peptide-methionine (R)-S-oxide reductase MsrB [Aliiroseovarius crassostreae]UWQ02642.1 peptide-methionine (R)-S-oxide reductase MsrB [Aliiroseovarius crassostreae]
MAKVTKTDEEWRAELQDELTFQVTRKAATERAYSHPGFPEGDGVFHCVCCGAALFDKGEKFESHCGWPAFSAPRDDAPIGEEVDHSFGMTRTEVHCDDCGAHLGHVFPDGPGPNGLRYCINGVCLSFEPGPGTKKG